MDTTSVFAPIVKSYEQDDGSILVYGKATGSDLDLDQQRCSPTWLKKAMPAWFAIGNIREQHDPRRAVGKAVEHEVKDDGHWIKARIVDPVAVSKTKAGVFSGFSIGIRGPRVEKSAEAPGGLLVDGDITEVSIVDRPAYPSSQLSLCKMAKPGMKIKSDDFDSQRLLVRCEELIEKTPEGELNKTETPEMMVKLGEAMTEEQVQRLKEVAQATVDESLDKSTDESVTKAVEPDEPEFDREAAISLVKTTLLKASNGDDVAGAMPPEYDEEQGDVANAQAAIGIISKLIISEAQEMSDNPAEDCDIQILLSAVSALRCFIGREQQQAMGANCEGGGDTIINLQTYADLVKAKYNADQLRTMLKNGQAMANANGDPSYPIADKQDLSNAIHAVGRGSGDHDKIRAYIVRRAKALGASDMIPDSWSSSGSNKSDEPDAAKTGEEAQKTVADNEPTETVEVELPKTKDADVTKAEEADTEKAVTTASTDPEAFVKVLIDALAKSEKSENPLRKAFQEIISESNAGTVKQLEELGERVGRVEKMPLPGGPAVARTQEEKKNARKADLSREVAILKAQARAATDPDLRKGFTTKAMRAEAQIKALDAA